MIQFIPTTPQELKKLGWHQLDIILISGDTYIDSPYNGTAAVGKWLIRQGFKVGVIAQPDIDSETDINRLGTPKLFWGVSAGSVDSMVANYTATKKRRQQDDFTPGAVNNRRPDRASIIYTNLIRRFTPKGIPVVLGGIEASLRRVVHYDFWSNKLRRSILFDAKADYLVYGMGENAIIALARAIEEHTAINDIPGICYISTYPPESGIELPSFEIVRQDKQAFTEMFHIFYKNNDPITAKRLYQQHGNRYMIQNPPAMNPDTETLDSYYDLNYQNVPHPYYAQQGEIRGMETVKFSVTTHRGCYGECNFCAIALHQGRTVYSRSEESILKEITAMSKQVGFKGIIHDVGGATANMYKIECQKKLNRGVCHHRRCLFPAACNQMPIDHTPQLNLLAKIRKIPGVNKVFITSGIRYDMVLQDKAKGDLYLKNLLKYHVSGQMKIAPEHMDPDVLSLMGKPVNDTLLSFKKRFDTINQNLKKKQYLTYYLIAAYPGCDLRKMASLNRYLSDQLKINPQQVQIFTPTPSTYGTLMYYTERNPFTGEKIFIEKNRDQKERQKGVLFQHQKDNQQKTKQKQKLTQKKRRKSSPRQFK